MPAPNLNQCKNLWRAAIKITELPPWVFGALYISAILVFAVLYFLLQGFNVKEIGSIESIYFSVVTITTLGYGEIHPISSTMRSITALEAMLGVVLIGLFLASVANKMAEKSAQRLASETQSWITGGNSIPHLGIGRYGYCHLKHFQGDYPIYDLSVGLQEFWLPLNNEVVPDGYWNYMKRSYPDIDCSPPFRKINGVFTKSIMLANKSDTPPEQFNLPFDQIMFPQTDKFMLQVTFNARNGINTQFIAGRITSEGKNRRVEYRSILLDHSGNVIQVEGDEARWITIENISMPNGGNCSLNRRVYDWPDIE